MFNIIFPIIIFASLGMIVFIIGKHLPEFINIKKEKEAQAKKSGFLKNSLNKIFKIIKNSLLWLVDQIIKKIKNFLTLIQSWIVSNDKNKEQQETSTQKQESTELKKDNFLEKITKKEDLLEKSEEKSGFFEKKEFKQEKIVKKSKNNFFANFKKNLKEKLLEKKRQKINQVFQETEEYEEDTSQYSDGIVKIHEKAKNNKNKTRNLINEVVEVSRDQSDKMNLDEELGVDRQILEKKLINKIGQNPRDKEVYRQLGELYLKMKNYNDSEGCYKQILKIAVRDIDARRKIERIKLLKRSQKK